MKDIPFDHKKSVLPAFMTPIASLRVPDADDINPQLEREILRRMKKETGKVRSNVGGWHSGDDLFTWSPPAFSELKEWLHSAILKMVSLTAKKGSFKCKLGLTGWANVNGPGEFNANHNHPGSHWSGVYYVRAGDYRGDPLPRAGNLQFYDPRGCINMIQHPGDTMFGSTLRVQPEDGLIVLFPAWLFHSVNPFTIDTQRISIAFNARIESFRVEESSEKESARKKTPRKKAPGQKATRKKMARKAARKTTRKKAARKAGS